MTGAICCCSGGSARTTEAAIGTMPTMNGDGGLNRQTPTAFGTFEFGT